MSNLSGEVVGDFDELFVNGDKYIHITNNNQLINGAGFITADSTTTFTNKSMTKNQITDFPTNLITADSTTTFTNKSMTKDQISDFPTNLITADSTTTFTNKSMTKNQITDFPTNLITADSTTTFTNKSMTKSQITDFPTNLITADSTTTFTNKSMTKSQITDFPTNLITADSTTTFTNKSMTKNQITDLPTIISTLDSYTGKTKFKTDVDSVPFNSDDINMLVTSVSSNTQDSIISIRGARNASTEKVCQLRFENFDDNYSATNKTNTLGAISGTVHDVTNNIGDLKFYTFADGVTPTETLHLKSDGNVGIGVTPTEKLHVNGNIKFTNKLATTDNLLYLIPNSTDDGGTYTDYRTIHLGLMGGDEVEGELRFGRAKVSDVRHHSIKVVCDSNNGGVPASNNYMRFAIHNGDGGVSTGQVDVLTLNGEGYAGIGTTTPVAPLTIDAVGAIAGGGYKSHLLIMDQTAYDGANNGGGILFGGLINSTPTATTGFGYWAKISGEKANTTADDTAGVLKFWTRSGSSPQQRMIIDEDGKVGIGIADPTETLHANGNIKCVDLKFTRADTNGADQEVLLSTILASYTQLPAVSINSGNKVDLRTNNQTRIRVPDIGGFETEGRVDLLLGGMYSASTPNIGELRFTRADTTNVNITRHNSIFTQHSSTAILNTLRFAIHNGTYDGNGSNTTDALTLTGTGSAVVGSDLIVTGNCQASTYSGLPLAATDNIGVLMVGGTTSGLSISSGGVLTANSTASVIASSTLLMTSGGIASLELTSNALTIDEFVLYTNQNINANSHDYLWRTPNSSIGSVSNFTTQGIRFVEGNDEFRCSKAGTFIVSFFIVCDDGGSNERASFYAQVVKTFGGSEIKEYYVGGNSYYRDNNDNYDEVCLCGTITFSLKLDESFLIRSIRLYSQGGGQITTHSSSRLSIERLNILTVIT